MGDEKTEEQFSIDDFKKADIRIGEIRAVEVVQDADKLLKLTVDVGESVPRTIVSGIREYMENPESLVGVRCPFVLNLPFRTIRGIESQGMILAVIDKEKNFSVLKAGNAISVGTRVS
jgi:methionyl-tRNA synthetase